jgi:hypothetical protein
LAYGAKTFPQRFAALAGKLFTRNRALTRPLRSDISSARKAKQRAVPNAPVQEEPS